MDITKAAVKALLEKPYDHEWSIQGLGMLRLYLTDTERLHIWNSNLAVPNVSKLHDHPWDFTSHIIAGRIAQFRYKVHCQGHSKSVGVHDYETRTILCGKGGCAIGKIRLVGLKIVDLGLEEYNEGDTYSQKAEEIHLSMPEDGTVSIISRQFKENTEEANVFWPAGKTWVSAEPRKATEEEIYNFTSLALFKWFT